MENVYNRTARFFHWAVVLAVIVQYTFVLFLPDRSQSPTSMVNFHMSFGILILILMLARLVWRLSTKVPPPSTDLPRWQVQLSAATHFLLYALLTIMPILGWLWALALGWQVTVFGMFTLPQLVAIQHSLARTIGDLHSFTGGTIIALLALHVGAALYHRIVLKDDVLQRMWP